MQCERCSSDCKELPTQASYPPVKAYQCNNCGWLKVYTEDPNKNFNNYPQ